jgi:hypothetical protein
MSPTAMQGLLGALKIKQERSHSQMLNQQAAAQLAQEKSNEQSLSDYRDKQLDQRQSELDENHRQFEINAKAAIAAHKVAVLEAQGRIANNMQNGVSYPGDTKVSTSDPDQNGDIFETHNVPGLEDDNGIPIPIRIPDRQTQLKYNTQGGAASDAPRHANVLDELDKKNINDLNYLSAQNSYNRDNQTDRDAAEMARTKVEVAGRQAVANTHYGDSGTSPTSNFDPTPYTRGALDGTTSQDDIKKLNKDQQDLVNGINSQSGIVPLTEKQKQFVGGLGGAVSVLGDMKSYLTNQDQNPLNSRINPTSDAYSYEASQRKAINEKLTQATTVLTPAVSRLSQPRINAMTSAYGMSPSNKNITNHLNAQNYEQNLNQVFDTELGNLSQGQRAHLRQQVGLATSPTPAPQQTQSPGQSQPIQQQPQQPAAGGGTHLFFNSQGQQIQQPRQ